MRSDTRDLHLVVFFTRSVSLRQWALRGMIEREVALYNELLPHLRTISFVTYGDSRDLNYESSIPGIKVFCNKWRLPNRLYAFLVPFLHFGLLRSANLFKTNQLHGADVASWSSIVHRKPVIVRAGYLWPLDYIRANKETWRTKIMDAMSKWSLHRAKKIVLTTKAMKEYVISHYSVVKNKIYVIPNFVDTKIFNPGKNIERKDRQIIFIGRLTKIKNIDMLIKAIVDIQGASLIIIGIGELENHLKRLANSCNVNVTFLGSLPNHELSKWINESRVFVLPSEFEGHPKVLIEAMGCGAAVVGTNVDGISNVIRDRDTGLIIDISESAIRNAITSLFEIEGLADQLGKNAREFVKKNYSLEIIVELEKRVYLQAVGRLPCP